MSKASVRSAFAAAAGSYDAVAALQRKVGEQLLAAINARQLTGAVLDLGCGTGFLAGQLRAATQIEQLVALDIALPMLETARTKLAGSSVSYCCADAERLPFVVRSFDTVLSNLALQWCKQLPGFLTDVRQILKPGGLLAFSTFGSQTLQELTAAWAEVDDEIHVNAFYSQQQLTEFLLAAGFKDIHCARQVQVSYYHAPVALLQELRQLGAQQVLAGRKNQLTGKIKFQQMLNYYEQSRVVSGVPATFEVILCTARA